MSGVFRRPFRRPQQPQSKLATLTGVGLTIVDHGTWKAESSEVNLVTGSFTPRDNSLLCVIYTGDESYEAPSALTISDSETSTWTSILSIVAGNLNETFIKCWYTEITTGTSMTVTLDRGDFDRSCVTIIDFTGYDTGDPIGITMTGTETTGTTNYTKSLGGTTASDSIVVGAAVIDDGDTIDAGSGWTQLDERFVNDSYHASQYVLGAKSNYESAELSSPYGNPLDHCSVAAFEVQAAFTGGTDAIPAPTELTLSAVLDTPALTELHTFTMNTHSGATTSVDQAGSLLLAPVLNRSGGAGEEQSVHDQNDNEWKLIFEYDNLIQNSSYRLGTSWWYKISTSDDVTSIAFPINADYIYEIKPTSAYDFELLEFSANGSGTGSINNISSGSTAGGAGSDLLELAVTSIRGGASALTDVTFTQDDFNSFSDGGSFDTVHGLGGYSVGQASGAKSTTITIVGSPDGGGAVATLVFKDGATASTTDFTQRDIDADNSGKNQLSGTATSNNALFIAIAERVGQGHTNHDIHDGTASWTKILGEDNNITNGTYRFSYSLWWRESVSADETSILANTTVDSNVGSDAHISHMFEVAHKDGGGYDWTFANGVAANSGTGALLNGSGGTNSGTTASVSSGNNDIFVMSVAGVKLQNDGSTENFAFTAYNDDYRRAGHSNDWVVYNAIAANGQANGTFTANADGTSGTSSAATGVVGVVAFTNGSGTADNLPAPTEITLSAVLDTPALGQIHVLGVTEISSTAVLDTPALGVKHVLAAPTELTLSAVLDTPTLTAVNILAAPTELTLSAVLDTPAVGQFHNLGVTELTLSEVLDTPAVGQIHNLGVTEISVTAVLDTPTVAQVNNLSAPTELTLSEVLDTPAVGQIHNLSITELTLSEVLDTPAVGQIHNLGVTEISVTAVLDTPTVAQVNNLSAPTELTLSTVLDTPAVGQIHNLGITELTLSTVLDTPTVGQIHNLSITELTLSTVLDTPTLGVKHVLAAPTELTLSEVLDIPTIGQIHNLGITEISVTAVLDTPTLTAVDVLPAPTELTLSTVLDTPTIGQIHNLGVTELTLSAVLDTPTLTAVDVLPAPTELTLSEVLDTPALGQIHNLGITEISVTAVLDTPTLSTEGTDNLAAPTELTLAAVLDTPAIGQIHVLGVTELTLAAVLDTPTLTAVDVLPAPTELTLAAVLDTPDLSHNYVFGISEISVTAVLDTPTLSTSGTDSLSAPTELTLAAVLDTPALGQIHNLGVTELTLAVTLDQPTLTAVDVLPAATELGLAVTIDIPTFGQYHNLSVSELGIAPILDTPSLGQLHNFAAPSELNLQVVLDTPSALEATLLPDTNRFKYSELKNFGASPKGPDVIFQNRYSELKNFGASPKGPDVIFQNRTKSSNTTVEL